MWLGPPCMKRKMTRFAWPGKCGGRTASGLTGSCVVAARAESRPSMKFSAKAPKPKLDREKNSRRELTCSRRLQEQSKVASFTRLVHVNELVEIENGQAQLGKRICSRRPQSGKLRRG